MNPFYRAELCQTISQFYWLSIRIITVKFRMLNLPIATITVWKHVTCSSVRVIIQLAHNVSFNT